MTHESSKEGRRIPTVHDIVTLLLPAYPELDDRARGAVEHEVSRYVAAQIASMPGFLRLPYRLALLGFEWLAVLRHGRPFGALPAAKRASYLALWDGAPIAPMRDFVKLIRGSALLVYFDHPVVLRCLEEERRGASAPRGAHQAANE